MILKRSVDLFLATIIITILSPIILFVLIIVSLVTQNNPIISQYRRLSLSHTQIKIWKIRTIKSTESLEKHKFNKENIFFKRELAEYIPPFCRWLRKSGFDEILQLLNVVRGDHSLIGPRPFLDSDLHKLKSSAPALYNERKILESKPGISGYWQLFGERSKGIENLIHSDIYYEKQKSIFLDLRLILKTIIVMISATHADSIIEDKVKSNFDFTGSYKRRDRYGQIPS